MSKICCPLSGKLRVHYVHFLVQAFLDAFPAPWTPKMVDFLSFSVSFDTFFLFFLKKTASAFYRKNIGKFRKSVDFLWIKLEFLVFFALSFFTNLVIKYVQNRKKIQSE